MLEPYAFVVGVPCLYGVIFVMHGLTVNKFVIVIFVTYIKIGTISGQKTKLPALYLYYRHWNSNFNKSGVSCSVLPANRLENGGRYLPVVWW